MSTIQVNGQVHKVQADSQTPLLHVLQNELMLKGPKYGCGMAQCGACTVHINGQAMRSCVMPVGAVRGDTITGRWLRVEADGMVSGGGRFEAVRP